MSQMSDFFVTHSLALTYLDLMKLTNDRRQNALIFMDTAANNLAGHYSPRNVVGYAALMKLGYWKAIQGVLK